MALSDDIAALEEQYEKYRGKSKEIGTKLRALKQKKRANDKRLERDRDDQRIRILGRMTLDCFRNKPETRESILRDVKPFLETDTDRRLFPELEFNEPETTETHKPDPPTREGWKPRRLAGNKWGSVLDDPTVAELPDDDHLPGTRITVTDSKGVSWTATIKKVVSRTDSKIVVEDSGRPAANK